MAIQLSKKNYINSTSPFRKLIKVIILSTIAVTFLLIFSFFVYHQFTFEWYDTAYILAQITKKFLPSIYISMWFFEFGIIYYLEYKKEKEKEKYYIDLIAQASNQLINLDDNLIRLPNELKNVEGQMNLVKQQYILNVRMAKDAEQRKNDLIVYLAHDLKTPLTSVIGYLTLLHDEKEISKELQQKYLAISLEKAERLEDLINEFFEITRFSLSHLTLETSKVNLTRMLEQIVFEFNTQFSPKNLTCSLDIPPNLEIKCDINKMQRVFDNLMRNAINYSFKDSEIKIIVEKKDDGIYIHFINNGDNISKERLSRIFEQFYRLDMSRGTSTGGAGLGLAIAKQIIELHGGNIKASSENEIITFNIFIPIIL